MSSDGCNKIELHYMCSCNFTGFKLVKIYIFITYDGLLGICNVIKRGYLIIMGQFMLNIQLLV
jgi:hypothetical protein